MKKIFYTRNNGVVLFKENIEVGDTIFKIIEVKSKEQKLTLSEVIVLMNKIHDYKLLDKNSNIFVKSLSELEKIELQEFLQEDISGYDFSVRVLNVCKNNEIFTFADLLRKVKNYNGFITMKNAGKKAYKELNSFLLKRKLSFGINPDQILKS